MAKLSKRKAAIRDQIDPFRLYPVDEALDVLKKVSSAKFTESVEVAVNLGVNARKSDQNVRGSTVMPHGTGKSVRVAVFTQGDNADKAIAAGADGFLAKPVQGMSKVQAAVLAHLPAEWRPHGPRLADPTVIRPDPVAYRDDMLHVAHLLDAANDATLDYAAQFLTSVAQSAGDTPLALAAEQWLEARRKRLPAAEITARIAHLVGERTEACETV